MNGHFGHGLSHIFKDPGVLANGLTDKKCIGDVSLHFQLELNTQGFLSVLTDKNLKDCGQTRGL
jgi:hypothetical protein